MTKNEIHVLLIDAMNLIRRVYGGSPLEDSPDSVEPLVGVAKGSIKRALKETQPTHAAMVYEGRGQTWRHKLIPDFKTNRKTMDQCVQDAIPLIKEQVDSELNIKAIEIPAVEADDVIATVATSLDRQGIATTILSTDKDFGQILGGNIRLRNYFSSEYRDPAWFEKKFGVPVEYLQAVFAFKGDGKDKGIPGVPGIGEKTAAKWLNEFGGYENLLANIEELKGKAGQNVRDNLDDLKLSYQLCALKTDVELAGLNLSNFKL